MENQNQVELEQYYNQIAAWYIKTNDIRALNMEIFLGGCNLYYLGKKLGFEIYTEVLVEFLLGSELAVKDEKDNNAMQLLKKMLVSGFKNKEESVEEDYNKIVTYFIKTGDITRIMYSRFIIGYTLYCLGKSLGCVDSTSILGKYLKYIQVLRMEGEESLSISDIRNAVSQSKEDTMIR